MTAALHYFTPRLDCRMTLWLDIRIKFGSSASSNCSFSAIYPLLISETRPKFLATIDFSVDSGNFYVFCPPSKTVNKAAYNAVFGGCPTPKKTENGIDHGR